jgi:hypothetical protein
LFDFATLFQFVEDEFCLAATLYNPGKLIVSKAYCKEQPEQLHSHTEKIQIYQPPNFNGWFHWATFLESGHFPM